MNFGLLLGSATQQTVKPFDRSLTGGFCLFVVQQSLKMARIIRPMSPKTPVFRYAVLRNLEPNRNFPESSVTKAALDDSEPKMTVFKVRTEKIHLCSRNWLLRV